MKLEHLIEHARDCRCSFDGGKTWVPMRPSTGENTRLLWRIKAAWRVLVGKSDSVEWPHGQ